MWILSRKVPALLLMPDSLSPHIEHHPPPLFISPLPPPSPPGAGKTTLLDVLAGRKTMGRIRGDILVNGYPKEAKTFAQLVG